MSTRANIVMRDDQDELIFYRHSDGYPDGTLPTLTRFLDLVITSRIRDNVGQAAGWLIIIGHEEYKEVGLNKYDYLSWKVGAYEPTTCIHGDIEYLYIVDLVTKTIQYCAAGRNGDYNATVPFSFYSGQFNRPNPSESASASNGDAERVT